MSLFDDVSFDSGSQLTCAQGHGISGPFQTKSTEDPGLDHYHVHKGRLFLESRAPRNEDGPIREETVVEKVPGSEECALVTRRPLVFQPLTRTLDVYTGCGRCKVDFRRTDERDVSWDRMDSRSPWVEYSVTFIEGNLTKTVAKRLETRETLIKDLKSEGLLVVEA